MRGITHLSIYKKQLAALTLSLLAVFFLSDESLAQSSLGIGVAEQQVNPSSPFAFLYLHLQSWQQDFARAIQQALITMRDNPQGGLWLILLSLIYGILHAAGPGHGKAVISSYLLADHASLKRGIVLSFFSSLLQAFSAIAIVLAIFLIFPAKLTVTTNFVVTLSFALVMGLGGWMLVKRSLALFRSKQKAIHAIFDEVGNKAVAVVEPARLTPGAMVMESAFSTTPAKSLLNFHNGTANSEMSERKKHNFRQICAACGKTHLIEADGLPAKLSLQTTLPLILATGLRPCAGALTVMSFALLNNLQFIGAIAVFAMALGTFVTVSALASLAVYAKKLALAVTTKKNRKSSVKTIIEWGASLFIFATGAILFFSSL